MNQFVASYLSETSKIVPGVNPENPNYKSQVGEVIYSYTEKLIGEERAPKITGMLIDLPVEEIREYLTDYSKFTEKLHEANQLLPKDN